MTQQDEYISVADERSQGLHICRGVEVKLGRAFPRRSQHRGWGVDGVLPRDGSITHLDGTRFRHAHDTGRYFSLRQLNMLYPRAFRLRLFLIILPLFVWFRISDGSAIRLDTRTFKFSIISFAGRFLVLFIVLRRIDMDLRWVQHTYMFVSSSSLPDRVPASVSDSDM